MLPTEMPTGVIDAADLVEAVLLQTTQPPARLDLQDHRVEMFATSLADPDRFVEIPRVGPQTEYAWILEFANALVHAPALGAEIIDAMHGPKSFARFRSILHRNRALSPAWRAFRRQRALVWARTWLATLGVDLEVGELTPSSLTPPGSAPAPDRIDAGSVGLAMLLALGAPAGTDDVTLGRITRVLRADTKPAARVIFHRIAREICTLAGVGFRDAVLEKSSHFAFGGFELDRTGETVVLRWTVPMPPGVRFG